MHTRHLTSSAMAMISLATLFLTSCAPKNVPPEAMNSATSEKMQVEHIVLNPADLQWVDAPPTLPRGAMIAVLEGDPSKPGPFTMRIRVPANYRVAPHYHPADEHVTIISGDFAIGMGETFDEAQLTALPTGSFAMMRTGVRHFAQSTSGAVVQLHGIGPWGLTYVNPADDPRNAKE